MQIHVFLGEVLFIFQLVSDSFNNIQQSSGVLSVWCLSMANSLTLDSLLSAFGFPDNHKSCLTSSQ